MTRSRRHFFRLAGCLLPVTLSGCSALDTTATDAPAETALDLSATVERQPSATDADPARLGLELHNRGSKSATVRFGPTLLYTDDGGSLDWSRRIVLQPDTDVGPWADPFRHDDCWRFPEDENLLVQSSIESRTLEPGDSIGEHYDVLTRGRDAPCLPAGTYRYQDLGHLVRGDCSDVLFTLELSVDDDHALAATATLSLRNCPTP